MRLSPANKGGDKGVKMSGKSYVMRLCDGDACVPAYKWLVKDGKHDRDKYPTSPRP